MKALNARLWSICHAKALPIILITVSASNTRGRKKPFSTLLILSFTPATSTLVLRGTLVLVRRILNSGTLEDNKTVQSSYKSTILEFCGNHSVLFNSMGTLFKIKSNWKTLISVITKLQLKRWKNEADMKNCSSSYGHLRQAPKKKSILVEPQIKTS